MGQLTRLRKPWSNSLSVDENFGRWINGELVVIASKIGHFGRFLEKEQQEINILFEFICLFNNNELLSNI